ncbi:hypothetical protein BH24ACT1_BH24ACT1_03550 [soil metagenome]
MTQLMEPRSKDRRAARLRSVPRPDESSGAAARPAPVPLWRRIVPTLAISVIVMAYVYATVPFTFAGAVECRQNGLSGATVAPGTPAGTIIGDVNLRCAEAGNSRIAVAGTAAGLTAIVGLAGTFAPTIAEVRARQRTGSGVDDREPVDAPRRPAGVSV